MGRNRNRGNRKDSRKNKQKKELRSERLKARSKRRKDAAIFQEQFRPQSSSESRGERTEQAPEGAGLPRIHRMDSREMRNTANPRNRKAVLRYGSERVEVSTDRSGKRTEHINKERSGGYGEKNRGAYNESNRRSEGPQQHRQHPTRASNPNSIPVGSGRGFRWKRPALAGTAHQAPDQTPESPFSPPEKSHRQFRGQNKDLDRNPNNRNHNIETRPSSLNPGASTEGLIEGRIDIHPDGFGFVIPKDPTQPNIYIPEESLKYCMHRDTVLVRIEPSRNAQFKARGQVVRIVKRQQKEFLGALRLYRGGALVVPLEARDRKHAFKITNLSPEIEKLKTGTVVLARIQQYPEVTQGTAEFIRAVDDPKAASNDTLRVLLASGWPRDVSKAALSDAQNRAHTWKNNLSTHRRDVRNLPLVTIDGRDARDFDDAVCAEVQKDGTIRLWVAIADVSFFVRPGTALDQEAYERSTSVYFPDHVVPMLPEVLSNGVCSLNPFEDRACLVCDMIIDTHGLVRKFEFYEGLMLSKRRLTYEQMQAFIEKQVWAVEEMSELAPSLSALIDVFHRLNKAKIARGAIDLDLPEAYVQLNSDGTVRDIQTRERLDAHRLIEECMLIANDCAARFIETHYSDGMYRVHEEPDPKKIGDLTNFIELSGIHLQDLLSGSQRKSKGFDKRATKANKPKKHGSNPDMAAATLLQDPSDFARLIRGLKSYFEPGDPLARAIQMLVLRSLKQARYSSERLGHFALATMDYTHFTSPIRRYPDLIVHRLIKEALRVDQSGPQLTRDLPEQGRHCSDQERAAMEMERKLVDIKKCRYLEPHLGEEFEAWVQGVTEKGIFCQLDGHYVEGLVNAENIARKFRLHFDPDMMAYAGPGKQFLRIGTRVKILLAAVDVETRRIDFELLEVFTKK